MLSQFEFIDFWFEFDQNAVMLLMYYSECSYVQVTAQS